MEGGGGGSRKEESSSSVGAAKPSKFAAYQNAALSAALTSNSIRPNSSTFLFLFSLFSASAFSFLHLSPREDGIIDSLAFRYVSNEAACLFARVVKILLALIFVGISLAIVKAIFLWRSRISEDVVVVSPSKGTKEQTRLTNRQLTLLGMKPKVEPVAVDSAKKPPKSKTKASSPSDILVPLHHPITTSNRSARASGEKSGTDIGSNLRSFSTPSKSPSSPSPYLVPASSSQSPSVQTSPGTDQYVSTPWSNKRGAFHTEIATEEDFEKFLADVDEKISESANKLSTPPPTINGFGMPTPNTISSPANTSGARRSTPLRPVRMSPGSQKFTTPPKKGEGDLPPPMSMEESIEGFEHLGIYPQIEQWRDHLRQWFSSVLINPLLSKIESSHLKVMQATAKLRITITISQVGSDTNSTATAAASPIQRINEWQPAFTLDEEGLLHQVRASLVQALDSCTSRVPPGSLQQSPQQNSLIPLLQEGIDAITEHQRLLALTKGEWGKGLLPHSSVRADYTVQRIRELAEGTCLKNYEYLGSGEVYDKVNKKWTLELPTDSHLLLYLFCAFLEHPKWMLHVDPSAYAGVQSSKNPLLLGVLPPKGRFPEKYIAVLSGVPSVLHPGACILTVGKQSPPVFALYWDKKLQFSLQGRTALWDAILLLCYKIKVGYGGIVQGMHLGSSALGIMPVLDSENEG